MELRIDTMVFGIIVKKKYEYTLVNKDGGNQIDYIDYSSGSKDGQSETVPVYHHINTYSQIGGDKSPYLTERSVGMAVYLQNVFSGHAIQPVTVTGTLSDIAFGYIAETTGSPELAFALSLFTPGASKGGANGLSKTVSSQKQLRHLVGTAENAKNGGGFMNSVADTQSVLDAVHSGRANFLGTNKAGFPVYRFNGVTGTNVNVRAGITGQSSNVFIIKGTTSPSVVPTNPFFKP